MASLSSYVWILCFTDGGTAWKGLGSIALLKWCVTECRLWGFKRLVQSLMRSLLHVYGSGCELSAANPVLWLVAAILPSKDDY